MFFFLYVSQGANNHKSDESKFPKLTTSRSEQDLIGLTHLNVADSIDWTNVSGVSYVTPVKDQGNW